MAGGPAAIGLVAFSVVKFVGYTAAGSWLASRYRSERANPAIFGLVRTLVGIAAGVATIWLGEQTGIVRAEFLFWACLIPVRMAEWSLVLWWFFERPEPRRGRMLKYAALGTAWSYALDVPAVLFMYYIPGGFWVC
jgi:hypothetical protein